jgi:radical SAM protein with 4Fe4S-binding SPASM domain
MRYDLPQVIEIELNSTCNLRCRMCHVSFMPDEPRPSLDADVIDRLDCLRGKYFIIGAGFEPMMNRDYSAIIRKLSSFDAQIETITNGTLLSEENVSALLDADVRLFQFSFDGMTEATYEHIRRRSQYASTLDAILRTRQRFSDRPTRFSINATMMKRNMAEVPLFVDFWDRAEFDRVNFIVMVVRHNEPELIRECLFPVRDEFYRLLDEAAEDVIRRNRRITIQNSWFRRSPIARRFPDNVDKELVFSDNPARRVVRNVRPDQLGAGPGMTFPCNSPWSFARILPNGDVQLCYQFTIGNLHQESFERIWYGDAAQSVRERVASTPVCESCDYFRFCLKGTAIDGEDVASYFAGELLDALPTVDFAAGVMAPTRAAPPILVETIGTFNIVRYAGRYFGAPHSLGPLDLTQQDPSAIPGMLVSNSLHDARRNVRKALGEDTGNVPGAETADD